jgi:hypothetical protein
MHHAKFCPVAQDESTTDLTVSDVFLPVAGFVRNNPVPGRASDARALPAPLCTPVNRLILKTRIHAALRQFH